MYVVPNPKPNQLLAVLLGACDLTFVSHLKIRDFKLYFLRGLLGASLVAQSVKNLPAVQETWVQSLGWEDPLEKEMATHSSILAWKISWTEEPGGLQSLGSQSQARLND